MVQLGTSLPRPLLRQRPALPARYSLFATPQHAFTPRAETGATYFLVTLVPGTNAWGVVARSPGPARARQRSYPKERSWFMATVKWLAAALVPDPSLGLVDGPVVRIK